jgi:hypothetical protein
MRKRDVETSAKTSAERNVEMNAKMSAEKDVETNAETNAKTSAERDAKTSAETKVETNRVEQKHMRVSNVNQIQRCAKHTQECIPSQCSMVEIRAKSNTRQR